MRRRLLVTGGSGFLGSRVARQGAAAGWEVVATSRRTDGVDITRPDDVRCLMQDLMPHAVVHTAYVKDVDAVTVGGSAAVAGASAEVGARLVHVSSYVVFSGLAARPIVRYGSLTDPHTARCGSPAMDADEPLSDDEIRALFEPLLGAPMAVAVSGGADSMALMHIAQRALDLVPPASPCRT